VVPFCLDGRFDADTLFLIFEEDFRFYPDKDDPAWSMPGRRNTYDYMVADLFGSSPSPTSAASSSRDEPTAVHSRGSSEMPLGDPLEAEPHEEVHPSWWKRPKTECGSHWNVLKRASSKDFKHVSVFLRDIVAYANLASRHKRGDFMFLGWQPHGAGDTSSNVDRYRSGTMLTVATVRAFRDLQIGFREHADLKQPGHVDQQLKKYWCQEHMTRVSYIAPPISGYTEHVSGCSREFLTAPRRTIWQEKFACPGTRASHDWQEPARRRWLCTFSKKGGIEYVAQVDVMVPDTAVEWLSFDAREEAQQQPTEPTAGWGKWSWNDETQSWEQPTKRFERADRARRQRLKFRVYTSDEDKALNKCKCLSTFVVSPNSANPSPIACPTSQVHIDGRLLQSTNTVDGLPQKRVEDHHGMGSCCSLSRQRVICDQQPARQPCSTGHTKIWRSS
jgi:hypothetical protein